MLVHKRKRINVEVEVDVDLVDVLNEWWDETMAAGKTPGCGVCTRRVFGVVDQVTQLLARVPDDVIAAAPTEVRCEVLRRLQAEVSRYELAEELFGSEEHQAGSRSSTDT